MTAPPRRDADERWRFPRGTGGLSPEIVGEVQRARLFEATCAALADQGGYGRTTVAKIVESAGISTRTFYQLFEGKDECLLAAHRAYAGELGTALADAWAASGSWAERVRAAIGAALAYGEAAPSRLRFLLLDAPTAGRALRAERRLAGAPLAAALREGRVEAGPGEQPPLTEEMLLAALAWRIGVALEDEEPLAPLTPALTEFALAPYLGLEAARALADA